eukprot:TRINITY_DN10376_c0_g1_i1.p1 TRINITY_DN10376_c0_g1~~TRINITY_DN10376_c0_g1_i1.p1  ORF type:complete len:165 (+),score=32.49 TRINITY_DN10376_c0_g1_i1:154-648(+)
MHLLEHHLFSRYPTDVASASNRALGLAAAAGSVNSCRKALELGADIDVVDDIKFGATPLIQAAFHGRSEVIRLLINRRCSLEARNRSYQQTALAVACCRANWEAAGWLVRGGADVCVCDRDLWTPLTISQAKYQEARQHETLESFLCAKGVLEDEYLRAAQEQV